MTCARDWISDLNHASYKGVAFFVERDQVQTGRRLVVHEFPHADEPYIEDLGRKANSISVTAYVASDWADSEEKSLRRVCESGGAGILVLPMERFLAHCQECSRDFSRDKLGLVAFSMKFQRDGSGPAPLSLGALARFVEIAAQNVSGPLAATVASTYRGLGTAGFVTDHAAGLIVEIAAALEAAAATMPLDTEQAPRIRRAARQIADDAIALAGSGDVGDALAPRSSVAARAPVPVTFPARIADVIDSLRLATPDPVAASHLRDLASMPDGWDAIDVTTPSRRLMAANQTVIGATISVPAVAHYVAMLAETDFADRRAAIQARADAAEAIQGEILRLGAIPAAYGVVTALVELSNAAANHFSRAIADLAPVLTIEANRTMPSLWWSNRLYGTHDRAAEIIRRNRVLHGSFVPTVIEAEIAS